MAAKGSEVRRGAPSRSATVPSEARLELVDALNSERDLALSAREVLRWLARHAGVEASVCALVDPQRARLTGLVGEEVPETRVESFALALSDREDPLLLALAGNEPLHVPLNGAAQGTGVRDGLPPTPLGPRGFHVVPLAHPDSAGEAALGLLLLAGLEEPLPDEVAWAARLLATRVLCARYGETRSSLRRALRERHVSNTVLDAVTDPIILTDSEGRMLFANARAETLLSAGDEDSEGRRRAVALNNMLFSASLFTATEHGGPARRELLLVDPREGQDLIFELLCTRIHDAQHDVSGIVSVLRDVGDLRAATEEIEENYRKLRTAEAEVRAERDRLDLILNAVGDPILVTDTAGNSVLMNPPAERLFEVGPATSTGARRHVQSNDVVLSTFVSNLYTIEALRWRAQFELADPSTGRSLPVEAIAAKVLSKGELAGVVTLLHDRSEALEKARLYEQVKRHSDELQGRVREATQELSQQNELLRSQAIALAQASQAKSQFLANMSHELRTPLNAILGYTNLFLEGMLGELDRLQNEKIGRIDANARHLVSLISDLLDITRIESGRMPVHVQEFDLVEMVDEVMKELEPLIDRSRLSVIAQRAIGLPNALSDRQKVKQILLNLLSNAIKFTPEGTVRMQCTHEVASDSFAVSVADTGIGIAPDQQQHIFEEFRQVDDSTSRQFAGTGLGLTICRRLAELVGGEISLVSSPGAGSTFTLTFPRQQR